MNRRDFIKTGGSVLALAAVGSPTFASPDNASTRKRPLKTAITWGTVGVKGSVLDKMKALKEAGFEGVEMNSHMNQEEVLRARDATGLIIPSVCGSYHWSKPLSDPNPKVREEGLEALKQTLRDAKR